MLYGIYVFQAAVAVGTFLTALVVFFLLGYESTFTLAILSGLLQFIPIIGPGALVLVIGFLPDVVIRPRLAGITTHVPASLYFIGFTGGILSVGVVGIVASEPGDGIESRYRPRPPPHTVGHTLLEPVALEEPSSASCQAHWSSLGYVRLSDSLTRSRRRGSNLRPFRRGGRSLPTP